VHVTSLRRDEQDAKALRQALSKIAIAVARGGYFHRPNAFHSIRKSTGTVFVFSVPCSFFGIVSLFFFFFFFFFCFGFFFIFFSFCVRFFLCFVLPSYYSLATNIFSTSPDRPLSLCLLIENVL